VRGRSALAALLVLLLECVGGLLGAFALTLATQVIQCRGAAGRVLATTLLLVTLSLALLLAALLLALLLAALLLAAGLLVALLALAGRGSEILHRIVDGIVRDRLLLAISLVAIHVRLLD
jgi:hypothetical protein